MLRLFTWEPKLGEGGCGIDVMDAGEAGRFPVKSRVRGESEKEDDEELEE